MSFCIARSSISAHFNWFCSFFALILLLSLHRTVEADCDCGVRCENYIDDEMKCMRCCTATVRRSIPLSAYPVEQLLELEKSLAAHKSLGDPADKKMMAEIVDSLNQIKKRENNNSRREGLRTLTKMLYEESKTAPEERQKRQSLHPVLSRLNLR